MGNGWREALQHERELREAGERAAQRALELQAREYDRRLGELNQSHERALREAARVVSQDSFEVYKDSTRRELGLALDATQKPIEAVNDRITALERQGNRWSGGLAVVASTGILAAIVGLVVGKLT